MRLAVEGEDQVAAAVGGAALHFHRGAVEGEGETLAVDPARPARLPRALESGGAGVVAGGRVEHQLGIRVVDQVADLEGIHRHHRTAALDAGQHVLATRQALLGEDRLETPLAVRQVDASLRRSIDRNLDRSPVRTRRADQADVGAFEGEAERIAIGSGAVRVAAELAGGKRAPVVP